MWFNKLAWLMLNLFTYQIVITILPESSDNATKNESATTINEPLNEPLPGIVVNSEINESNVQENLDDDVDTQPIENKPVVDSIQTRSIKNINVDNKLDSGIKVMGQVNRTIKTGEIYSTDPSPGVNTTQKIGEIGNK